MQGFSCLWEGLHGLQKKRGSRGAPTRLWCAQWEGFMTMLRTQMTSRTFYAPCRWSCLMSVTVSLRWASVKTYERLLVPCFPCYSTLRVVVQLFSCCRKFWIQHQACWIFLNAYSIIWPFSIHAPKLIFMAVQRKHVTELPKSLVDAAR
jgi:hypothetical protein